jgi:hypothetical protein
VSFGGGDSDVTQPTQGEGETPAPPPRGWREYGCFIWALLPFVAAIPVWLLVFPESYDRAVDFTIDVIVTGMWLAGTVALVWAVIRSRRSASGGAYLLALVPLAAAGLMGWNLAALYSRVRIEPAAPFGWDWATRPHNLGLLLVGVLVCLGLAAAGFQKIRGRPPK